jgi:hypothetical protein
MRVVDDTATRSSGIPAFGDGVYSVGLEYVEEVPA